MFGFSAMGYAGDVAHAAQLHSYVHGMLAQRRALEKKGVEVSAEYIGETFSILSGGIRRGTTYEGRLEMSVDVDLEKLVGWTGAKIQVKAFQIHNGGANAASYAGVLSGPSNIDALPTTRLFTAWFQRDFGEFGSLRIGQLAADDEFVVSETAGGLLNSTFGWPNIMAANLPSGGAAFPLATPGARLALNLSDNISLLGGVFSGAPAGWQCYLNDPNADPQDCNRHGGTFSFHGGGFWIAEVRYQMNQEKDATGLAAAYKIGGWYHAGRFSDQHFGIDASDRIATLALAPESALYRRGNWGVYGVVDQMIWRGPDSSISIFARAGAVPSDRNLISWYADAGVGIKGLFPGRPDDTLTFGVAHSTMSRAVGPLDRDTPALAASHDPIRSGETVFELSYIFQLTSWWTFQPDFQYIVRPAGGALHPDDPTRGLGNVFLIGARTRMSF